MMRPACLLAMVWMAIVPARCPGAEPMGLTKEFLDLSLEPPARAQMLVNKALGGKSSAPAGQ
jgi:hypothetical protein